MRLAIQGISKNPFPWVMVLTGVDMEPSAENM